jgi:sigma-B regulation protein RsbU (phosphoserine phosphatase)
VSVEDDCSIAARVYRERRIIAHDPAHPGGDGAECGDDRGYKGHAFLSVPICYGAATAPLRCVGVINLTDRIGGDRFTLGDRKLVAAIANQIGAAVENARLVERDARQQRLQRELELAHDLQLKLSPSVRAPGRRRRSRRAAIRRTRSGGDFYTFSRLGRGRVG